MFRYAIMFISELVLFVGGEYTSVDGVGVDVGRCGDAGGRCGVDVVGLDSGRCGVAVESVVVDEDVCVDGVCVDGVLGGLYGVMVM